MVSASDPDSLLPLLCSWIDNIYVSTEKLRKGVVEENHSLTGRVHSLEMEV